MGVLLVTGGSRGIGAAIARVAARKGYDVCVNYVRARERADEVAAAVRAEGRRALVVQADVSREEDIMAMFRAVDRELGPIDALVNNAGIDYERLVADVERSGVERVFGVNVIGLILCCREAVRRMSRDRGGHGGTIVNISSVAARTGGLPKDAVYTASKGAVDTFTRALSIEVAAQGVRVCSVRPDGPHRPARGGRRNGLVALLTGSELRHRLHLRRERRPMTLRAGWPFRISLLLALTLALPRAGPTQLTSRASVGFLSANARAAMSPRIDAFRRGLHELGYVEGQQVILEYRFAEGRIDRLPTLATELVRLPVSVIVTEGATATRFAKEATSTIPIVMAQDPDPVGAGLVASLARPGGNVTGLSNLRPEL